MSTPPPGWLPDPAEIGLQRYWDGLRWTERTRDSVTLAELTPWAGWDSVDPQRGIERRPVEHRAVGHGVSGYATHGSAGTWDSGGVGIAQPASPSRRARGRLSPAQRDSRALNALLALVAVTAAALVVDNSLSRELRVAGGLPDTFPRLELGAVTGDGGSATGATLVEPEALPVNYPVVGSTPLVRYLEAAMIARQERVDVSYWGAGPAGTAAIDDAMREALAQNPYVFVGGWSLSYADGRAMQLTPDYLYDADQTASRQEITHRAVDAAVGRLAVAGRSPAEVAAAVHDYVARIATYDYAAAAAIEAGSTEVAESQEAYGILGAGTAVCTGYAQAFAAIGREAGLDVVIVTGEAWDGMTSGGHAWNRVLIDDAWLTVDVTWDDGGDLEPVPADYLLLRDGDPLLDTRVADDGWMVDEYLAGFAGVD